ncbi:hypothetical protein BBBOND_0109930 [Babesia bigemina]|uniref:Uncharacterized protein n=1 Tax=Babesia bigemina TaxID=5866 RepID=A0A061DAD8_BABBI|nr:hypothetical protein BBBOND_0109930 [Babesia bigemina]CDR94695.1 hypothetical protein BBBOND_0109930 [Babesia bigemina]|eukprot:XP_012766881.1 hypothetical protein BBBOND_0109930 [Babesia bigemina]
MDLGTGVLVARKTGLEALIHEVNWRPRRRLRKLERSDVRLSPHHLQCATVPERLDAAGQIGVYTGVRGIRVHNMSLGDLFGRVSDGFRDSKPKLQ